MAIEPQDKLTEAQRERIESAESAMKPLRPYLAMPNVQEVAVNQPGLIYTWQTGEWVPHTAPHIDFAYLENLTKNMAELKGSPFNETSPVLDVDLHTGERFHAKRPPVTPAGEIYCNVRKHVVDAYPFQYYVDQGYFSKTKHRYSAHLTDADRERLEQHLEEEEIALWQLAKAGKWAEFYPAAVLAYQNMITSGATGSGKTTFSRSLMELTDPKERYVTLQDARETPMPNHPNRQDLLFRKGDDTETDSNGKTVKKPGFSAKQGLESAMRSTPTRIHMSELRGDEAMYYLSGVLSSGHPGGITTAHSNSPKDCFLRIALLIKQSKEGQGIELEAVKAMLYQSINVVGQLKLDTVAKRRYMTAVYYDPHYRVSLLG
jgi:type IV secretion system protein VirB11